MNKQEYQQKIKNMKRPKFFYAITLDEAYEAGFEEAKNNALFESCFLDEPEKPVVPQFVADYIEENRDALEEYVFRNVLVTLPVIPADDPMYKWLNNKGIGVIVDCIRNGYEVEKEKLYTVKLKSTNEYMFYDKDYREIYHIRVSDDGANQSEAYHFTEDKLIKYHAWENEAYEIKEVKE